MPVYTKYAQTLATQHKMWYNIVIIQKRGKKMLVRVNNPKLKNHGQIGIVLYHDKNYYNCDRDIPIVVVQLINHPYK